MEGYQSQSCGSDAPGSVAPTHGEEFPLSPISSEDVDIDQSSYEEGDSGDSSGLNTASDPVSEEAELLDRDAATSEIMAVLSNYPGISVTLLEWARIFIEENPEMLTRSSTIVDAFPDGQKADAEFYRGISAICRIISNDRLSTVRDFAIQLEGEWVEALVKGGVEVGYGDFIDLIYSEAERVMERGEGWYREEGNMEIVSEVFGFLKKDPNEREGAVEVEEDAMGNEG